MPSAQAPLPDDEGGREAGGSAGDDEPVLLEDIDRILQESAGVADAHGATPVRAWRDALRRDLEALIYARSVLADDVAILRHRLATDAPSSKEVVDDLPDVLAGRSWGAGWSEPDEPGSGVDLDPGVFARADVLVAVHAEMATLDLTSPEDVRRVLADLEGQLGSLVTRQEAVETRLEEIRATIVRQYEEGIIPTQNWPG
ncbi:MAG TPA: hypothetical protein VMF35_00800 [Acidimicrobiales bacterium]|nr:hypothetical protein [Acidimicrobiales bacterium]